MRPSEHTGHGSGRFLHRLSGVVARGDRPLRISQETMERMRLVPGRIQMLRRKREAEDEELRAERMAAILARMPAEGGRAKITKGPLAGYLVSVQRIDKGIARCLCEGFSTEIGIEGLEKVND